MDFPIRCQCGALVSVPETAAGATYPCDCGQTLEIPTLSQLRRDLGFAPYRPPAAVMIEHMLADGELPSPQCVGCGGEAAVTVTPIAECEKTWQQGGGNSPLAIAIIGLLFGWIVITRDTRRTLGRNLTVPVPVRLCPNCVQRAKVSLSERLLPWLKWPFLPGAAVAFFFAQWLIGLGLLAGFVLILIVTVVLTQRRNEARKLLLREVPIYAQLMDEYPEATIVWE